MVKGNQSQRRQALAHKDTWHGRIIKRKLKLTTTKITVEIKRVEAIMKEQNSKEKKKDTEKT